MTALPSSISVKIIVTFCFMDLTGHTSRESSIALCISLSRSSSVPLICVYDKGDKPCVRAFFSKGVCLSLCRHHLYFRLSLKREHCLFVVQMYQTLITKIVDKE